MNRTITRKWFLALMLLSCIAIAVFLAQGNAGAKATDDPPATQPGTETPQTDPATPPVKEYKVNHTQLLFNSDRSAPFKMLWFNKSKVPVVSYTYNNADGILFLKKKKINGRTPLMVYPLKPGTTSIILTDPNGTQVTVPVTVDQSYFKAACRDNPYFTLPQSNLKYDNELLYGEKKFVCYDALSSCKVKMKIEKDSYKFKANNEGSFKIKLKKTYKAGTSAVFTFTAADGKKYTKKAKIQKWSEMEYNKKLNKKFTAKVVENNKKVKMKMIKLGFETKNIHSGDYVVVKINGKTYQTSVKKDGASKIFVKVPAEPKGTPFKATLRNNFDQKMLSIDCEL